ncbi:MAG: hypothetical protein D6782_05675, partial [Alphaproteobacteria bacterium]
MRGFAWIFIMMAAMAAPANAKPWPDIVVTCKHADKTVTAVPQIELPQFKNWRVATADCGADITARFYTDGDQIRVAFEYQKPSLWESAPGRDYTAIIELDGAEVYRADIADQKPYTRWSWRLKQPVIVRTPADLAAARLTYNFSPVAVHNDGIGRIHGTYKPLDTAGFIKYMRGPGGRQDFGPVTEAQGCYLATQDAECARVMFDQADSSGSWPWNARDPATGAPLRFDGDMIDTSYADSRFGSRHVQVSMPTYVTSSGTTRPFVWDRAHLP